MDKLFLLDAYALIYRSYYAFIRNPRINSKGLNTSAIMGFCNTLNEVLTKEKPTHIGVAFDHGLTFRNEAFPEYKAQREETPEDIRASVPIIKDILKAYRIPILQVDGFEADDVIGTLATKSGDTGVETYMLTPDKDYGQLVKPNVFIFRPRHGGGYETLGEKEIEEKYSITTPLQVIDILALMGDTADNFPGCPGIGEKTAIKLISDFGDVENLLSKTEQLKGKLKEKVENAIDDIKMSKFLATIRKDVPIELNLDELKIVEPDNDELTKIFGELEMKSFAERVIKKPENKPKVVNQQLDLFASEPTDGQEITKETKFETLKTIRHNYKLIDNQDEMKKVCDFFFTKKILSLDTETTEQFNISSPKQVGDILFDKMKIIDKPKKTKTGQYVTSEEVLQQLKSKSEIVSEILDYRGLKKLLGTYVDALPKLINQRTGHIHTSFNQAITATGRLSSSDPNLQNIPVRGEDGKEIRKCFIPEPGCLFFSADYSQIELRVMAHLSGDANMIEAFREGYDIHAATAAKIYKKEVDDVSRDERTKAKRANFGIIYGITVFGLAERLDITRDEAKQLIDGYFETFPQVREYMETSKEIARKQGYVETFFHRRRYLPDINSHNATVRGFAERNAINAPIQGSAADIIKVAMIRIFDRFKRENIRSKMILQVHDELNFSVYPDEKEQVEKIVLEEMQNAYQLKVPLVADAGWGQNWLEAH
jgi:DNA polymerase I-like protein with 3'-5' exonuclease and polymerase domains